MKRLREYLRQRYGGRPSLLQSFRNLSLEKPGYVVPADLQLVFDQMGLKITRGECQMLIEAVDKDYKGGATFALDALFRLHFCAKFDFGSLGKPHEYHQ